MIVNKEKLISIISKMDFDYADIGGLQIRAIEGVSYPNFESVVQVINYAVTTEINLTITTTKDIEKTHYEKLIQGKA